jgi:hypothetical protein
MHDPTRPDEGQIPAHPDQVDADVPGGRRRAGIAIVALLGALIVLIVVLHITGVVGPGAH